MNIFISPLLYFSFFFHLSLSVPLFPLLRTSTAKSFPTLIPIYLFHPQNVLREDATWAQYGLGSISLGHGPGLLRVGIDSIRTEMAPRVGTHICFWRTTGRPNCCAFFLPTQSHRTNVVGEIRRDRERVNLGWLGSITITDQVFDCSMFIPGKKCYSGCQYKERLQSNINIKIYTRYSMSPVKSGAVKSVELVQDRYS